MVRAKAGWLLALVCAPACVGEVDSVERRGPRIGEDLYGTAERPLIMRAELLAADEVVGSSAFTADVAHGGEAWTPFVDAAEDGGPRLVLSVVDPAVSET